ncbi:hypothetical protein [Sphingomicrobium clamense]|uniref:PRC-barrel domain-containing protein n=1 Tax=Sphingomicrobium clamense TaxID=2851013 RepID=A0ABS6V7A4_9SPHN|nr:hypothetical protein [Sphingomicrobium sp. B8]MBW0145446.1 hypothetical protein [Sphingomicrobium sp. B8]
MNKYSVTLSALAVAVAAPSLAQAQSIGIGGGAGGIVGVGIGQDIGGAIGVGARGNAGANVGSVVDRATGTARQAVGVVRESVRDMPPPPGAEVSARASADAHGHGHGHGAGGVADVHGRALIDLDAVALGSAVANRAGEVVGRVRSIARNASRTPVGLAVELDSGTVVTVPHAALAMEGDALVMLEQPMADDHHDHHDDMDHE